MLHRYYLLLLLFLAMGGVISAQIVTTQPAIVNSTTSVVEVYFTTTGTALEGYTSDVYAHTGVITDKSTGDTDWKYAPTWLDNSPKYKLTPAGSDRWKLTISPSITAYYGVATNEKVLKLAFVFRNADGSKEGKDQGKDIFVPVMQHSALAVQIQMPAHNAIFSLSDRIALRAVASELSDMKLFLESIDSSPLLSLASAQELTYEYVASAYSDLRFIVQASNDGVVVRDTTLVAVLKPSEQRLRPADLKEGIHPYGEGVSFLLYAPNKQDAVLLGDFNEFAPRNEYVMQRDGDFFWLILQGLDHTTEYAYQYLIDRSIRIVDPRVEKILDPWNDSYINQQSEVYRNLRPYPSQFTTDVVGCFQLVKPSFEWTDAAFVRPPKTNLVIYELLFRDFTEEGSVHAALQKLDYLQSLGVNAIELMPIQEFEGNDSWGYNPNFYFALDKAYGDDMRYKEFINECHRRGIAVIVDVVFNHSWGQHPWCKLWYDDQLNRPSADNPFYNPVATHPYSVGNDFNHSNARLRSYFSESLQYLMKEYHVDGFRFDLSKGFTQTHSGTDVGRWGKYDAARIGYIKEYVDAIRSVAPDAYAIMEHFAEATEENEIAAYHHTQLWRNANHAFAQAAMGYPSSSDFSSLASISHVGFMESHDEERIAYKSKAFAVKGLKTDSIAQFQRIVANAAFVFLSPGARMLWQFGEWGYDVPIDYNGRTGRKPILWNYYDRPERRAMTDAFSRIIRFRTEYPQLFTDPQAQFEWSVTDRHWKEGRYLSLRSQYGNVVVAANYSLLPFTATIQFPHAGEWYDLVSGRTYYIPSASDYQLQLPSSSVYAFVDLVPEWNTPPTTPQGAKAFLDARGQVLYVASHSRITSLELFATHGGKCAHGVADYLKVGQLPRGVYLLNVFTEEGGRQAIKVMK